MLPGHCFTIEVGEVAKNDSVRVTLTSSKPCLIQGSNPRSWIFPDGWTASTEVSSLRLPSFRPDT
jgi:methionyl aminopeptidase